MAASASAPELRGPRVYSVGELTREVKAILEARFPGVLVEGELSNLRRPSSGHLYFTLKDEDACVDAVLFKTQARALKFTPDNGHKVLVRGRLSLYEPQGRYQIICDSIEPLGAGALQVAFEQLKARLSKEGLFDKARKRALPYLPRRIAVVTSPSGAAVHDFLRVLHRRYPNLPVLIVPARVQGEGAAQEIARAIGRAARANRVDVVVVARGGGSLEDLWPFNDEIVARALANCPVPTVSAVGHEVDFTIADFVADARAATPTAAAELLARVKEELLADLAVRRSRLVRAFRAQQAERQHALHARGNRVADPRRLIGERRLKLDRLEQRLGDGAMRALAQRKDELGSLRARLSDAHPREHLHRLRREVARLGERLAAFAHRALAQRRQRFEGLAGRLDALSPLRVLARGYAVAFDRRGHALRSAAEASVGDRVTIRLGEGQLAAQVVAALPPADGPPLDEAPAPLPVPAPGPDRKR
ncbi:MAG TPA: exodeoxyribonuclease VII large subunit [Myxococcales bacterium]|jgi:exodeoxyribonuclease VII large subunit|nr:exodeoxyribonuclease VII large subunit [Myxococcales bacterium]